MHVGKNIGTLGMLVLLLSVNTLRFQSREIPTFSFDIDTRNYKDQTESKHREKWFQILFFLFTRMVPRQTKINTAE